MPSEKRNGHGGAVSSQSDDGGAKRQRDNREEPSYPIPTQPGDHLGLVTADALLALTLREVLGRVPQDVAISEASNFLMEQGILHLNPFLGTHGSIKYGDVTIPLRIRSAGSPYGDDQRRIELASADPPKHANGSPILYQQQENKEITFSYPPFFNDVKLQLKMLESPSFMEAQDDEYDEFGAEDHRTWQRKDKPLYMHFSAKKLSKNYYPTTKKMKKDRWNIHAYMIIDLQSERTLINKNLQELFDDEFGPTYSEWFEQEKFPTVPVDLFTVDLTYILGQV